MASGTGPDELFEVLEFTEYETAALRTLLTVGSTTAPNLAEATGIPKARIYGVLDDLTDRGFVKEIPGRPKTFHAKHPDEILDRAVENERASMERTVDRLDGLRGAFVDEYGSAFERASDDITPTEELFYVVDVGEPSETETRRLYDGAEDEVNVLTKGFEYFDRIATAFADAVDRGLDVRVIFLHPSMLTDENAESQAAVIERLATEHPSADLRFSDGILPWRGTFADPSMSYESGRAVLLVEEKDIPLHMRQAAVTENAPFVAGMKRYFDLLWHHECTPVDADAVSG